MARIASDSVRVNNPRQESFNSHPLAQPQKQSFIFDTDTRVVEKLGKNAAALFYILRQLADGRTGELRVGPRWLKATYFDRKAGMCRNTRQPAIRELVAKGLVTIERTVVRRMIGRPPRLRAVSGPRHYTVYKRPISAKTPIILLKPNSCAVQEMGAQVFPETPCKAAPSAAVLGFAVSGAVEVRGGREGPPPLSSSTRHHEKPKPKPAKPTIDDDESNGGSPHSSNPKPEATSTATPGKTTEKPKPVLLRDDQDKPKLRAWMHSTIMARLSKDKEIRNLSGYLRVSELNFDLPDEIEKYLFAKAEQFCRARLEEKPGERVTIYWNDVLATLQEEARKHEFPLTDDGMFARAWDFAADVLGLVEPPEPKAKPKEKRSWRCAKCGRTERWHNRHENLPSYGGEYPPNYCVFTPKPGESVYDPEPSPQPTPGPAEVVEWGGNERAGHTASSLLISTETD